MKHLKIKLKLQYFPGTINSITQLQIYLSRNKN